MDGMQVLGPNPEQVEEFARVVLDAVQGRNYALLASLGVVLVVYLLRKFGGARIPFLRTDRGGALLVLVVSLSGAVANALAAGAPFSAALLLTALRVGLTAAGGFTLIKRLVFGEPAIARAEQEGEAAAGAVAGKAAAIRVLEQLDTRGGK